MNYLRSIKKRYIFNIFNKIKIYPLITIIILSFLIKKYKIFIKKNKKNINSLLNHLELKI